MDLNSEDCPEALQTCLVGMMNRQQHEDAVNIDLTKGLPYTLSVDSKLSFHGQCNSVERAQECGPCACHKG